MHRRGHLGITLLFAAPIIVLFPPTVAILLLVPLFFFASIPDKDQKFEWVPGISHRGITHTLLFGFICAGVTATIVMASHDIVWRIITNILPSSIKEPNWLGMASLASAGAFAGIVSHILGDIITVGSRRYGVIITPYWPLTKRAVRLGWCYADDKKWNWGLFLLGTAASGIAILIRLQMTISGGGNILTILTLDLL